MPPARTKLPSLDDRLPLGRDDVLRVSPFCLGMVGEPNVVPHAFDLGINFFFVSADLHWPRYEATRVGLARLLARGGGVRDRIVVAATSYCTQPEFLSGPALELLDAVPALERVDVLVAGGAYGHEIDSRRATYHGLLERRHAGARAFGISFHDRHAAANTLRERSADIVYVRYNPSHPGARDIVFPVATAPVATPLYGFKSTTGRLSETRLHELGLADHHWHPRPADYYRFSLTSAEMTGLLIALSGRDEVDALAAAMAEGPLSDDEQTYLLDLADIDAGRARMRR